MDELIKWLIAGGGWIVALLTVWIGYHERNQAREEERLQETLQYFTGGTQKRSIGIALIEGVWQTKGKYLDTLVPVIANQLVYLLVTTDSQKEAHEERNLVRLFNIFKSVPELNSRHLHYKQDVLDALEKKIRGEKMGLDIAKPTLEAWQQILAET